jgi:hypothetical protein
VHTHTLTHTHTHAQACTHTYTTHTCTLTHTQSSAPLSTPRPDQSITVTAMSRPLTSKQLKPPPPITNPPSTYASSHLSLSPTPATPRSRQRSPEKQSTGISSIVSCLGLGGGAAGGPKVKEAGEQSRVEGGVGGGVGGLKGDRAATPMEPPSSPVTFFEGGGRGGVQGNGYPTSAGRGSEGLLPSAICRPKDAEDEGSALVGKVLDMRTPPATQERKPVVDLFPPPSGSESKGPDDGGYRASPPSRTALSSASAEVDEAAESQVGVQCLTFNLLRGPAESGAANESTGLGLNMVILPSSGSWHVVVTAVGEGGTAAQDARILPGDVITHIQGQPVGQPPIMADLISRIKGKPSSNVELRLERGWSVLSSALAVSEAGAKHPPTKQSQGGMESVSAGSISQHMASLEAKNKMASGNTAATASAKVADTDKQVVGAGGGGDGDDGASSPRETLEQVGMEEEQRLMQALAAETKCLHLIYQVQHKARSAASKSASPNISP